MIVIVDDSKLVRRQIEHFIVQSNYDGEIEVFDFPIPALDFINKNIEKIQIIFIDYNMDQLNGIEVVQKIDPSFNRSNVFLITANIQKSTKDEAFSLGINFIEKPVDLPKIKHSLIACKVD